MYGNYGNEQSEMTLNRAAYGSQAASLMSAGRGHYGSPDLAGDPLAQIGSFVRPATYAPPVRMNVDYYGMYQQSTGIMSNLGIMAGIKQTPRGIYSLDYGLNAAGDMGERLAGGLAGGVGMIAGTLGGGYLGSKMATGFLASTALGLGGYMAGGYAAQKLQESVAQRRDINNFLESSSFRFVGQNNPMADPRGQGGMGINARQGVTDFIKSSEIRDPFMSMDDMSNILKGGANLGLFNGTKDIDDFKKKFKDITDSVKTVTRTLHVTLEDGLKTIKELKSIGIDPSQVKSVVGSADALGRTAGRTAAEMVGIGLQGAEVFRGTGVSMQIGMQATMMNLASVRASRDAGLLSQEAIAQAGGEEALSARMSASGLAYGQSTQGRGLGAAFFSGGAFNQNAFMSNIMGGGGSLIGLAQRAAGNLSSPAALISYQANQDKFLSEMGKTFGERGLQFNAMGGGVAMAGYLSAATGANKQDAYKLSRLQAGASYQEIESEMAMMQDPEGQLRAGIEGAEQSNRRIAFESLRQQTGFNRMVYAVKRVANQVMDYGAKPISRFIDKAQEGMKNLYQEGYLGVTTVSTRGLDLRTSKDFEEEATGPLDLANSRSGIGEKTGLGGLMGLFRKAGAGTVGDRILDSLNANEGAIKSQLGFDTTSKQRHQLTKNDVVLSQDVTGKLTTITREQFDKFNTAARSDVSLQQALEMEKSGQLKNVQAKSVGQLMAAGKLAGVTTEEGASKAMFGLGYEELSTEQKAMLKVSFQGTQIGENISKNEQSRRTGKDINETVSISQSRDAIKKRKEIVATMQKEVGTGVTLSDSALTSLALARGATSESEKEKYLAEAMDAQVKASGPNATADDVEKAMRTLYESGKVDFSGFEQTSSVIKKAESGLSSSRLGQAIEQEVLTKFSKQEDRVAAIQSAKTISQAVSVGDYIAAIETSSGAFKQTTVGAKLTADAQTLKTIQSAENPEDGSKLDGDKLASKIQGLGLGKGVTAKLVGMIGSGRVTSELKDHLQAQSVSQEKTWGTQGQRATADQSGNVVANNLATQLNINIQVHKALSALAQSLEVRRK